MSDFQWWLVFYAGVFVIALSPAAGPVLDHVTRKIKRACGHWWW